MVFMLREEHRVRMFENSMHEEELHDLCPCEIIMLMKSGRMRWVGHVARTGKSSNCIQVVVGKD